MGGEDAPEADDAQGVPEHHFGELAALRLQILKLGDLTLQAH